MNYDEYLESRKEMVHNFVENMLSNDEKPQYQVMGDTEKVDHTFEMNEEEKRKYEEVGRKIENLTKELDEMRNL